MSVHRLRIGAMVQRCWKTAALAALLTAHAQVVMTMQLLPLAAEQLLSTPTGRQTLKYLVSCALEADAGLVGLGDVGPPLQFQGQLGLAPAWTTRALTPVERRWVSACMLARLNRFGTEVKISLRTPFGTQGAGLQWTVEEARDFPLEEATFFGDLFGPDSMGYVCSPEHSRADRDALLSHQRVCALRPEGDPTEGVSITACQLQHVGVCSAEAFVQDGITYQEAITTFLPRAWTLPRP